MGEGMRLVGEERNNKGRGKKSSAGWDGGGRHLSTGEWEGRRMMWLLRTISCTWLLCPLRDSSKDWNFLLITLAAALSFVQHTDMDGDK